MLNDKLESIKDDICWIAKGVNDYWFKDTDITRHDLFCIGLILVYIAAGAPGLKFPHSGKN